MVCEDGLRIVGDEQNPDGVAHRARYTWAADRLTRGSVVLDFGCGTGYGAQILQDAGYTVVCHDPPMGHHADLSPGRYDAIVAFEVLEHLESPPFGTLQALERISPVVLASVPYLERDKGNPHHRWFRLQEATFPGRAFAYQYPDGTISRMPGTNAQNLLIVSIK